MAPEFFPISCVDGLGVIALVGLAVGVFLVFTTRKKRKLRLLSALVLGGSLLLLLFVYFCIPSTPRTSLELCGTYILDCELVHEELTLSPEGTFSQTVSIKATGEEISSVGKWAYHTRLNRGLIFGDVVFDNGLLNVLKWPDELKADYSHQERGTAFLPAEYYFSQLELGGRVDSWPQWKKVK